LLNKFFYYYGLSNINVIKSSVSVRFVTLWYYRYCFCITH